ncbi:MAG: hypothetical protein ACFFDF_23510 [Candidatus Odinarchaeota archaeon]
MPSSSKKTVKVKPSKEHTRSSGWVSGYWRKKSKPLSIKGYSRKPPKKKKPQKKKKQTKKKTTQTRLAKPRNRPARRSLKKA